jgi:hypothetical protein
MGSIAQQCAPHASVERQWRLDPLLSVPPSYLPLLEELSLSGHPIDDEAGPFVALAHPSMRVLELGPFGSIVPPSEERMRSWLRSERLPKLERYVRRL